MKKALKKICAVIMAAATLFCLAVPVWASTVCTNPSSYLSEHKTEGVYTYYITDIGATVVRIDGQLSGDVVIPDKLGGASVVGIDNGLFAAQEKITSVKLPDTVKFIGARAFMNCAALKKISIPDGVTTIEARTFERCWALSSVRLPAKLEVIESNAFFNCSSLKKIELPETVKAIHSAAFAGTSFYNNESNWDNNLLYLGHMLVESKGELPDKINVKKGTRIINIGAFSGSNVTEVVLPEGVEYLANDAFNGCSKLEKVILPSTLKEIGGYAFYNCVSLKSVTVPEGVTEIYEGTFNNCLKLEEINIPAGVTKIGRIVFTGTPYLEKQLSDDGVFYLNNSLVCVATEKYGELTVKEGTVRISDGALEDCFYISSVTLPDSLEEFGDQTFFACRELKEITIPDKVRYLNFNIFSNYIEVINIGKGTEEIVVADLRNLREINIHKDNKAYLSEDNVIYNKSKTVLVKSFDYVSTEFTLPLTVTEICSEAFSFTKYKKINLHDGITKIHADAFLYASCTFEQVGGCRYVGNYLISGSGEKCKVRNGTVLIADKAFLSVYGLKEIYLPESVMYVGENVINNSQDLKKITVASPYTEFCDCSLGLSGSKLTVYGYTGSEAQKQAERHSFAFVSIGEYTPLIKENAYIKLDGRTLLAASGVSADRIHKNASVPVEIFNSEGKTVTGKTGIATGMVIKAEKPAIQLTVIVLGDVDCDGKIRAGDARMVLRASVGLEDYSADAAVFAAADVAADGTISAGDAREILRVAVGLADSKDWL